MNKKKKSSKKVKKPLKRLNYSPNKLSKAISDVQNGTKISAVAKTYNIPRTTLLYKMNGQRPQKISKPGPQSMLGDEIEQTMVKWILESSDKGFPLTKNGVKFTAKKLIDEGHGTITKTFNKENGPGRRWFQSFMERHPELSIRHAEYLHKARTIASEPIIRRWFKNICDELGSDVQIFEDPKRVFNCDETSIYLHPKSVPVVAAKGQRNVYDVSGHSNKENVTVLITANAAGDIAPPLALYSFQRIPDLFKEKQPDGWGIGRAPNGWMTCEVFYEYISNVFNDFMKNFQKPIILFLDGHKSHLSLQLSHFCRNNGIILIALPPNATHILQPLDVAFFFPLKNKWKWELEQWRLNHNGKEARKQHVLPLLDTVLKRPEFKRNLGRGFERCGLYPLNPDAVDYTKCKNLTQEPKTPAAEQNTSLMGDNSLLLTALENILPASMKTDFERNCPNAKWPGEDRLSGLFYLYKSLKHNLDFENLINEESCDEESLGLQESYNMLFQNDLNEVPIDFEFQFGNCNDSIVYVSEGANNSILPISCPLVDVTNSLNFQGEILTTSESPEIATTSESPETVAIVERNDKCAYSTPPNSHLTSKISPEETRVIEENFLTPPTNTETASASTSSSASSNRSVREILDSVIRFDSKKNDENDEKTGQRVRKKLNLPSVMTSNRWLELKEAMENEKQEVEDKKKEKQKVREKKRKEIEKLKVEKARQREEHKKLSQSKKLKDKKISKKSNADKIERPVEVKQTEHPVELSFERPVEVGVGNWVVVEFETEAGGFRKYIAEISEVKRGKFWGNFLRSADTKEHRGYVYKYPQVKDFTSFSFQQIACVLPEPASYGRGMLKFCINNLS